MVTWEARTHDYPKVCLSSYFTSNFYLAIHIYIQYIYTYIYTSEEGHRGFLKDISVKIIDRLTGGNRMREIFWQYRLDCFAPKGLNTRQVDT